MAGATSAANNVAAQPAGVRPEAADGHRNAWILTGYGIFGLVLLAIIAYSVAQYVVS
jgi:hypothetical protein